MSAEAFEKQYTQDQWDKTKPKDCLCYIGPGADENGRARPTRVMLCSVHGDSKATGGKKGRAAASDLRSDKGGLKKTPLKNSSDKQDLSSAYLQGIKDSLIWQMLDGGGQVWCQRCEKDQEGATSLEAARSALDLHHHDQERDEGPRYNHQTKNPGRDHPQGLLLVCRPCHKELGGK